MGAPSNVVPFRRQEEPLAYALGVTPFDRSNPVHVRAWNVLHEIGWSEQRFRERERREHTDGEGC